MMAQRQSLLDRFDHDIPTTQSLSIEIVPQVVATAFYIEHHYLHTGCHGMSLDYAINLGSHRIGFISFTYPLWTKKNGLVPPCRNGEVVNLARICFGPALDGIPQQALELIFKRIKTDWLLATVHECKVIIAYCNLLKAPVERDLYLQCGFKPWGRSTHKKSNKLSEVHPEYGKQKTRGIFIKTFDREWGK